MVFVLVYIIKRTIFVLYIPLGMIKELQLRGSGTYFLINIIPRILGKEKPYNNKTFFFSSVSKTAGLAIAYTHVFNVVAAFEIATKGGV